MELVPKCIFLLISLVPTGIRWCSKNCILIITWKPTLIYTCINVGLQLLSFMCVMTRSAKITLFLCIFTCNNAVNCIQYCSMYWQNPQTSFFAIICRRPKTRFYFLELRPFWSALLSPSLTCHKQINAINLAFVSGWMLKVNFHICIKKWKTFLGPFACQNHRYLWPKSSPLSPWNEEKSYNNFVLLNSNGTTTYLVWFGIMVRYVYMKSTW